MSFAYLMGVLSLLYFALQTRGIHSLCGAMGTFTGFCQDSSQGLREAQSSGSNLYKAIDPQNLIYLLSPFTLTAQR